ncbi:pyruvate kinase [Paracoccus sp. SCSIO 75233]|uniref:pyruvate kinase n=1 Tax=Paracoccus sp. SCSIO 75233 TaxID=3017782 RepID=UPI0022F1220B|nr:pyruvate kinase [Paracoccus sp. SCSIO 75233]WBU53958.1 pyruvate kinase [Paracoccus sp. SCSIO 75233]
MMRDRRARIVATVGPASAAPDMLRQLFQNGVDTFRLNFSHGEHETHAGVIAAIRALEADMGVPIGILQDLQGPKIRLGKLSGGPQVLERSQTVVLSPDESADALPLPHPEIFGAIQPGHRLFIDDGRVRLVARSVSPNRIEAEVEEGGKISDRKGVNLPDTLLDLPVLTEKDRRDLAFGLVHGVDWVALSFVQNASDLDEITRIIDGRAGLVAKIEKPSALDDIDAIVARSDAIMIARGDLGVEIPPEEVPARQKELIALCRRESRPVIVATQMLESMTASPAPTRAEASDVATAIYDGADAVMLSAESAAGAYPAEAVAVMDRIIRSTEVHAHYARVITASREAAKTPADAIADHGAMLASALNARAVVAYSRSGSTAARISARRPFLPLIVLTRDPHVARRMALLWGAQALTEDSVHNYDSMVETALRESRPLLSANSGDSLVILSGVPFGQSGSTNNIRIATFA